MSAKTWSLKRTVQCAKCPWRKVVDPRAIPDGYSEDRHHALRGTIAEPGSVRGILGPLKVMACHETRDAHCVGWVKNQAGPGNNIALRINLMTCDNARSLRTIGAQHPDFDATLPKP